jgi:Putative Flp pilus-assembly TadE/G-like
VIRRLRRIHHDEGGTVILIVTLVMVVLLLLGGLVVDLGGLRGFRGSQQSISDAAAAAGAVTLGETRDGQAACQSAKAYVISNAREIVSLSGIDCSQFPTVCDSDTPEVALTTLEGRFTVGITHPVSNTSPLMDSEVLGALDQPASAGDGHQCERIAVSIESTFGTTFSQLAGIDQLPANVHTVAKASTAKGDAYPVNLLVLDRTGCQTIRSSGNGGIYVDAVYDDDEDDDPVNGLQPVLEPGLAAADSDGSDGCSGTDGVIDIDGSNAVLRADGPAGCSSQTGAHLVVTLTAGEGCGKVQTLAAGTPGCNFPACTFGGSNPPNPEPTELPLRLTRAAVDYRYNCKPDYTSIPGAIAWATWPLTAADGQDIPGCLDTQATHIDDLIATVGETGTPIGFQSWTGAGYPCTVQGPPGTTILVPAGDWHVDCPAFVDKRTVVFQGGNVVFDGSVDIESAAILAINASGASHSPVDPEAWVFLRSGYLRKAGDAALVMNNTFVYAGKDAHVEMAGGDGRLVWVAPDQGDFDDLALWGDSPTTHLWAGQADLEMEGVFFTPFAQVEYAGTSGQNQVRAQFVAHSLHARGQGTLVVAPESGRSVQFPRAESALIR